MSGGRVRRLLGVVLCAVALIALGAAPASAHDDLLGTTPADGTTLATAPDQVVLTFTDPALALGTQVVVTGPDGTNLAQGPVQLVGSTVVQPLAAARPAGVYRVDWRVTSADGHPVSSTFTFAVTSPSGPVSATPTTSPAVTAIATATAGAPIPEPSLSAAPIGTVDQTAASGSVSGNRWIVGLLVLAVLGLTLVRFGRARSLRRIEARRVAAAGPDGADGAGGAAGTSGGA